MSNLIEIKKLRRQQTAIVNFGTFALNERDLQKILNQAARVCAEGLGARYSKICRYRIDENDLLIEAGFGWRIGLVGNVVSKADESSPQGRAFATGEPVICEDIRRLEAGYILPKFYSDHGIISTIDVLIQGSKNSYGVLEVDSDELVIFDEQDVIYLTGFANVLAEALAAAEQKMREVELELTEQALKAQSIEIQIVAESAQRTAAASTKFIATLSHEIRTPLNVLFGTVELLSDTRLDNEQKGYVSVLQDNVLHLRSLVNDIIIYSRLEAGKVELDEKPFDIRKLLFNLTASTEVLLAGLPINFKAIIDNEVSSNFLGDVKLIRQVLTNILANAVNFTKKGSISIKVTEKKRNTKSLLRFEVQDTGIGIDPAMYEKVFDFYERAGLEEDNRQESSGIGLAISSASVKLMGGEIGVVSDLGKGSAFWFEIPLEIAQPLLLNIPPIVLPLREDKAERKRKILIAEDSTATRRMLEIILGKLGHEVVSCANGADAVAAAGFQRFDLIILDLQMPVMGGVKAARKIRAMSNKVGSKVIIALTADTSPDTNIEALAANIDQVITKPFEQKTLIDVISKL